MRIIILLSVIIAFCISNCLFMAEYLDEYSPDNFSSQKLVDKRYRCIKFFHEKRIDKFAHTSCKSYHDDYIMFMMERSRYICLIYADNAILMSLFVIFYLLDL